MRGGKEEGEGFETVHECAPDLGTQYGTLRCARCLSARLLDWRLTAQELPCVQQTLDARVEAVRIATLKYNLHLALGGDFGSSPPVNAMSYARRLICIKCCVGGST